MRQHTIAFVNSFKHIAENVGRLPTPELCAFLRREGAKTDKVAIFRPKRVNDAIRFLLKNNVQYAREWGDRTFEPFDESVDTQHIPDEDMVELTEEEAGPIDDQLHSSDSFASADTNVTLYHRENAAVSREEHIRENLNATPANVGNVRFDVPRHPEGLAHPSFDNFFYEKAFPSLFPYGYGGPNDRHGLRQHEYVELLLKRGGTPDMRRFGTYPPFMMAVYSYKMRKIAGGVAYVASLNIDAAAQGEGRGALSDAVSKLKDAPDAETMIRMLKSEDGKLAKHILRKLEPYAERLEGSPAHILKARKELFARLGSPVMRVDTAAPTVFTTMSPADRFYPELPHILKSSKEVFGAASSGAGSDGSVGGGGGGAGTPQPSDSEDDVEIHIEHVKDSHGYTKAERVRMLREHPVLAARLFESRHRLLMKHIYMGEDKPFGEVTDYWVRIEFQGANKDALLCDSHGGTSMYLAHRRTGLSPRPHHYLDPAQVRHCKADGVEGGVRGERGAGVR